LSFQRSKFWLAEAEATEPHLSKSGWRHT
jgi:hypothetical protein